MGKHLLSKQSSIQFRDNNPSCMWGMLQFLDYHHWHYVKKMFPHKKHGGRRQARYRKKSILFNQGSSEAQEFEDAEEKPFLVRQHRSKVESTNKKPVKTSIKAKHTKDRKCKECDNKDGKQTLPLEKEGKIMVTAAKQKLKEANKPNGDISDEEFIDVLEMLKVKEDFFLKISQDRDFGRDHNHGLQASNARGRLTKSGSYPISRSSPMTNISPSILKHMQNEVWAFSKEQKELPGNQTQKIFASNFAKDNSYMKSKPMSDDGSAGSFMKQKGLNNHGWNQSVLNRFKFIKQKIKHALMEFMKDGYQTSTDAIDHRAYSNSRFFSNGDAGIGEDNNNIRGSYDSRASDYDTSKHKVQYIQQTSSLNESIDRYTHLFEKSFGNDIKWHTSKTKSLRLANDDKAHISRPVPKLSKRNLSLPDLDSLCFSLYGASFDTYNLGIPGRTSVDCHINAETDSHIEQNSVSLSSDTYEPFIAVIETEVQNNKVKMRDGKISSSSGHFVVKNKKRNREIIDHMDDINEAAEEDMSHHHQEDEEIGLIMKPGRELGVILQDSGLETSYQHCITSHAEGTELATWCNHVNELDLDVNPPNKQSEDSLPGSFSGKDSGEDVKSTRKDHDNPLSFESNIKDDPNFKFVKDVVELSGFMGTECLGTWQTVYQLHSSYLKDYETVLPYKVECFENEIGDQCDDYQLLFDLVNEMLIEINEKSFTYFPRPLFFNRGILSMPTGQHLLKEVWSRTSFHLSLRPELDQSLDDVVARDLAKGDGWMNLQYDTECVALELEDIIFEELLDEVICSRGCWD